MVSTRRLTAILAADVAGYSRLMGADEEGTHERLKAHLRELVNPKIEEHRGRIVKNTGDGLLAEFPSVVDAVRCAVEVQRGMTDREPDVPEERRIRFRIGVNLGDVIVEPEDIFGDGVNVAARLERHWPNRVGSVSRAPSSNISATGSRTPIGAGLRPNPDRPTGRPKRDRFGLPVTRLGVRLIRPRNGLATRTVRRKAQPIIPVIIARMKPIAPSQSKSPTNVRRPEEMSGSILPSMIGLLVNVGRY